jgi:serine/threonine-protein kinase
MSQFATAGTAPLSATALLIDQRRRWQQGERILVEEYLRDQPALRAEPETILHLLYHEILLREGQEETPHLDEYVRRFPQLATELHLHFEVHAALQAVSAISLGHELSAEAPAAPAVWPVVPGYEILAVIGRGGMGVVYKARHLGLNRLVALKMMGEHCSGNPDRLARFRSEAEAVARLQSPHIVQIHDIGGVAGQPYFALELIDGGSLAEHLNGAPAPQRQAAALVETVARAVHHAHERGIIHRDLKPANVLLQIADGRLQNEGTRPQHAGRATNSKQSAICNLHSAIPKITDFGLAKFLEDRPSAAETQSGDILGTPSYMAPEQASGVFRSVSPATDIYALGAILYEMLTGRPPFRGVTFLDTLQQVRNDAPAPPRRLQPGIELDLETICLKCLEKEPGKRYSTAQGLADDLARFLANRPIQARAVSQGEKLWRWCRRKPVVAALLAALVIVFLAGGSGVLWQWHRATRNAVIAEQNAADFRQERDRAAQEKERAEHHLELVRKRVYHLDRLGHDLLQKPGQYRAGQSVLEEALAFYQELLPEEGNDPKVRQEAAQLFGQVAWIHTTLGQVGKAAEAWDRQAGLLTSLLKEDPASKDLRLGLAHTYRWRGNALRELGKVDDARTAYDQAAALQEQLLRESPGEAGYQVALANTLLNTASVLSRSDNAHELEPLYRRMVELDRAAVRVAPDDPAFKEELALMLGAQGMFFLDAGRTPQAKAAVREALEIQQKVLAGGRLQGIERYVARNFANLGLILAAEGQMQEAEKSYRQAVNLLNPLVKALPDATYARADLARTLFGLADLLKDPGHRQEVEQIRRSVIRHYEMLRADFPDNPEHRHRLLLSYLRLVDLLWELGRQSEAAEPYRKALELAPEDAVVNNELAWFLAANAEPRLRDSALAVRLAKKAVTAQPQIGEYRNTLGVAYYRKGDDKAAITELEVAMRLRSGGDSLDWFFLAMAHWRLGDRDKARTWFDRAVQWMDKHKPHDDELRRFRAEAEAMLADPASRNS